MFRRKAVLIFNFDKYGCKRVCSYCGTSRVFGSHETVHCCFCEDCGSKFVDDFRMGDAQGEDLFVSQILKYYRNNYKKARKMKMCRSAKNLMNIEH